MSTDINNQNNSLTPDNTLREIIIISSKYHIDDTHTKLRFQGLLTTAHKNIKRNIKSWLKLLSNSIHTTHISQTLC